MQTDQTEDRFLVITNDEVTYRESATQAVIAAGCPPWDCMMQAKAARALEPGDELSVLDDASIIRITGKDITYGAAS